MLFGLVWFVVLCLLFVQSGWVCFDFGCLWLGVCCFIGFSLLFDGFVVICLFYLIACVYLWFAHVILFVSLFVCFEYVCGVYIVVFWLFVLVVI